MFESELKIRAIVIAIIWRGNELLVGENTWPDRPGKFYRPLGGGIELGEYSQIALVREIREELDTEITDLNMLTVLENIFVWQGQPRHEIVFVYEGRLVNEALYLQERIVVDTDGVIGTAVWRPLSFFDMSERPLYPDFLFEFLSSTGQ